MSKAKAMAAEAEILRYERNVNEALRGFARRTGYEPSTADTPLYSVLQAEDGGLDEWSVRNETVRRLFAYLTADGPHPAQILRRLYAVGSHMAMEPFCLMNLREKAMMLGDSHGAQHWRMKRICTDPLMRKGARSIKAPGQKSAEAAAAASRAQQGNHNRVNGLGAVDGAHQTKSKKRTHEKNDRTDRRVRPSGAKQRNGHLPRGTDSAQQARPVADESA